MINREAEIVGQLGVRGTIVNLIKGLMFRSLYYDSLFYAGEVYLKCTEACDFLFSRSVMINNVGEMRAAEF